jgi:hypothetical protein
MFSSMALWQLVLLGALGGVVIAIFILWRGPGGGAISEAGQNAEIRIDKIPIKGGIGAALLIIVLLTGVLLDLPALRWLALPGVLGGVVFGGVLILWRRYHRG